MPLIRKPNFPVAKRGKVFKKLKISVEALENLCSEERRWPNFQVFFPRPSRSAKKNNLGEGEERRSVLLPTLKGEKWAQSQSLFGIVAEEEEEERQKIEVTCIRQAGGEKD